MTNGFSEAYVKAAIDGEVARLASAQPGERNQTLFKCTAALASLGLRESEILRALRPSADAIGLRSSEILATVKSGVKAGHANPREVPSITTADKPAQISSNTKPMFVMGGDDGPPRRVTEVSRYVYRRAGSPVRIKIKYPSSFASWYRVVADGVDGWQSAKPAGYEPCPYIGAVDPFAPGLVGSCLYWPEGEKDCDTLGKAGLPALTFGGAGDGLPDGVGEFLRGHHVVILADNDPAGREHANKKAAVARVAALSVKILEFPELPLKGDVTDYLQTATVAELEVRVNAAPLWQPTPGMGAAMPRASWQSRIISADQLKQKVFKPIRYVLPGYIPEGLTIFAGKPKAGKSWLLYDVCVACAADRFVLGSIKPARGDVLYLALEDSQRRLKQRLDKLYPSESWPAELQLVTEWSRADAGGIADITAWCRSVPNPLLIVIDTLERFRPVSKPGPSAYAADYAALADLQKLSHEVGIAIVVIHHVRKMDADDPFDMVSGTNGLTGAADTILVVKKQSGNVTLYSRGRDIDEKETALQFNRSSCRWTILGEASEVHGSSERAAVLTAVSNAGPDGMSISEIMVATGRRDRNAVDQLLYKMHRDGDLTRVKRGIYAPGKIGKKERNDGQAAE